MAKRTYISVGGYGRSLRNVDMALFTENRDMVITTLSVEDARELARLLLCAAKDAEGDVVCPDSHSMAPQECARIVTADEREAL